MTKWSPRLVGGLTNLLGITAPQDMTQTEAKLLDDLQHRRGLAGLDAFKKTRDDAIGVSAAVFKANRDAHLPGARDGHQDAFRHIYWNVLMSRGLGEDFATAFGTAHERAPGNRADEEAMDLYNNELGRRIARENPDATEKQLPELVMKAIQDGKAVVIGGDGRLVFSNESKVGETGKADDAPAEGVKAPPK